MAAEVAHLPTERRIIIATDAHAVTKLTLFSRDYARSVGAIGIKPELDNPQSEAYRRAAELIRYAGARLFVDAQLNRVPYDIALAVRSLFAHYKAHMITVSAAVGERGFAEAVKARDTINDALQANISDAPRRCVYATSLPPDYTREECRELYGCDPEEFADKVTKWGINAGVDGISCGISQASSAYERRTAMGTPAFAIVVSGVRRKEHMQNEIDLTGSKKDICTPYQAIMAGADYLLVGKTLTSQYITDCASAYNEIVADMAAADAALGRSGANTAVEV